jgi:hypothetical protein
MKILILGHNDEAMVSRAFPNREIGCSQQIQIAEVERVWIDIRERLGEAGR